MYIPEQLKDLDPKKYTNLFIERHNEIALVACDDWKAIVTYSHGKKYWVYPIAEFMVELNDGQISDPRVVYTPDPYGLAFAWRNAKGEYENIFIHNEVTEKKEKNVLRFRLIKPASENLKLQYEVSGLRKTIRIIAKNKKEGYFSVVDLTSGEELEYKKGLSLPEVDKLFASPKKPD